MTVETRLGDRLGKYGTTEEMIESEAPMMPATVRDVTDLEEAFRAVRNSEEHFRSIIENASDVIAIVALDGRIRYESPSVERVLGYPPGMLVGTPFIDLVHPDDAGSADHFLKCQIADPSGTSR